MINPKLIIVILALTSWGFYERSGKLEITSEYNDFKSNVDGNARIAKAKKDEQEKEDAKRIADAESAAAVSVKRLRDYQARTASRAVPGSPQTANADTVCWSTERLDLGLRELEGIIIAGSEAMIDRTTLMESWPK